MRTWLLILIAMVSALATGIGCSGKPIEERDPATLYKEAEEDVNNDHYQIAVDKLRIIKNKHPYSNYATLAQLKLADVYYLQESFGEAALAYENFRDLHPKHEKTPYAMFRIGKSYFGDMPSTIARDLTSGNKALDAYNDFLKKFPGAPEAGEAKKDIEEIRDRLAEKELYIGNFYYKQDQYESALMRYQHAIDLYPETKHAQVAKDKLPKTEILAKEQKAEREAEQAKAEKEKHKE